MELSKRLQAVADLVTPGLKVADVGTDHGYIPIYLIENKKNPFAVAMDINKGPLKKAEENITLHGLKDHIETRLSDGVEKLMEKETDSIVIAGMGGALVIHIMEQGSNIFKNVKEFILQPQSEIWKVRKYLMENGYKIIDEDMVLEDGKFYPMMKVVNDRPEEYSMTELNYGKILLQKKNPVLKQFLEKEARIKKEIYHDLNENYSGNTKRMKELEEELKIIQEAQNAF